MTPSQLERLLAAIDEDYAQKAARGYARASEVLWLKDLITVAVNTGLRRGELVNLRWSAVDFESGFLTVRNTQNFTTKSGHERSIPIAPDALKVLRRLHAAWAGSGDGFGDDFVFRSKAGGRLDPSYASKRFKHYVRKVNLPESIHFHSLRHTCASWLVMRGVNLRIVQAVLGHSDIQVTQQYAHLAPDVMKAAIHQAFGGG